MHAHTACLATNISSLMLFTMLPHKEMLVTTMHVLGQAIRVSLRLNTNPYHFECTAFDQSSLLNSSRINQRTSRTSICGCTGLVNKSATLHAVGQ